MKIRGLHHITAITADAKKNQAFYVGLLGLRRVKVTVNYDDPSSYHLYYGDTQGRPGSILTFFVWQGAPRGSIGAGEVSRISFAISPGSESFWRSRLHNSGIALETSNPQSPALRFRDPDGIQLALTPSKDAPEFLPWESSTLPLEHAIRGIASVTFSAGRAKASERFLLDNMGLEQEEDSLQFCDSRTQIALESHSPRASRLGAGSIHHIAFKVRDEAEQHHWHQALMARGSRVSPIMDRTYFRSIYFRDPSGILFEFATEQPGFAVDEAVESMGTSLALPKWLEAQRHSIVAHLQPLL